MRAAVLCDIHGNLPALEAVLAEVEASGSADVVVCGGDAVAGPFPREVLALLRDLGDRLRFVRGNADRNVVDGASGADADAQARWCAEQLARDDIDFLARLPLTESVTLDGLGAVLFCHGTPRSDEEIVTRVTTDARLRAILAGVDADVVVAGHTHSQIDRALGRIRFVNAGSVGMPYEHEQGAYWALVGPDVELRRTPYDADDAARRIRETGFPEADAFALEYVLSRYSPDETAPYFEGIAAEREHGAQAANSEK
jgi:putative phosphoesterase